MRTTFRPLIASLAAGVLALGAAGAAQARVHHHHHCHTVAAAEATTSRICHHHHCHTVTAGEAVSHRVCHHHHCHTVTMWAHHPRGAEAAEDVAPNEGSGPCKSVRLHGEWVQRCHFEGQ